MLMLISNFGRLYVGDFLCNGEQIPKIVLAKSSNLIVDGTIMDPSVEDLESNCPVRISRSNHVKPLGYYMNRFGIPNKKIPKPEKEKQGKVLEKVKELYREEII